MAFINKDLAAGVTFAFVLPQKKVFLALEDGAYLNIQDNVIKQKVTGQEIVTHGILHPSKQNTLILARANGSICLLNYETGEILSQKIINRSNKLGGAVFLLVTLLDNQKCLAITYLGTIIVFSLDNLQIQEEQDLGQHFSVGIANDSNIYLVTSQADGSKVKLIDKSDPEFRLQDRVDREDERLKDFQLKGEAYCIDTMQNYLLISTTSGHVYLFRLFEAGLDLKNVFYLQIENELTYVSFGSKVTTICYYERNKSVVEFTWPTYTKKTYLSFNIASAERFEMLNIFRKEHIIGFAYKRSGAIKLKVYEKPSE